MKSLSTFFYCACCVTTALAGNPELPTSFNRSARLGIVLSSYVEGDYVIEVSLGKNGENTEINGPFIVRTPDGSIVAKGTARNGELEGEFLEFDGRGYLRVKMLYLEGVPVGQEVNWDDSGRIWRIVHRNKKGQFDGVEQYFADGIVSRELDWREGESIEMREFEHGELKRTFDREGAEAWRRERAGRVRAERLEAENK